MTIEERIQQAFGQMVFAQLSQQHQIEALQAEVVKLNEQLAAKAESASRYRE